MMALGLGLGLSFQNIARRPSLLLRQEDGTVTVERLEPPWTPRLTREEDGTITVGE